MNAIRGPHAGVATIWFVTAAQPLDVLVAEPGHDRGFGRKYLALLDPRLTVSPIGDFPLNRSAPAGPVGTSNARRSRSAASAAEWTSRAVAAT